MNNDLLFDFSADKENNSIHVKREFAAKRDLVWAAWTQPELLDKWWAPKPFKAKTKTMDFKEGGRRLYAMVGPEGEKHWALTDYTSITPKTNFKHKNGFCDEAGNLNTDFSRSNWSVDFEEKNSTTFVKITIQYENQKAMEQLLEMGFKEGFTAALDNLEELLSK